MPLLDQPLGRVLLVAALLALASFGLALARRRDGVFRPVAPGADVRATAANDADPPVHAGAGPAAHAPAVAAATSALTAAELGVSLGTRATLVQLSSPGCATCPQVRRVLGDLAAARPGVVHVEIDASQRLDLARRLNVLRTPTVLVLGPAGELRSRTSGRVDPDAAARALDEHAPAPTAPLAASLTPALEPRADSLEPARA